MKPMVEIMLVFCELTAGNVQVQQCFRGYTPDPAEVEEKGEMEGWRHGG